MLEIDKLSRTPIYEQLVRQLELMIMSGELKPGDQLPSVRILSQQLSVNPNTLQRAFLELERRGICQSVPGSGRFITPEAVNTLNKTGEELLNNLSELVRELKLRGVPIERVHLSIDNIYAEADPKPNG